MIHFSGVPESNLEILIMYFPGNLSPGVLWYIKSICLECLSSSFSGLVRGMIGLTKNLLGQLFVFWGTQTFICCLSCYLASCREVMILCPKLKIGQHKTLFKHCVICSGCVRGQLWLFVVN